MKNTVWETWHHHSPKLNTLHVNHCNVELMSCMDFTTAQRFTLNFGGTTNTRIHMVKNWNYVHAHRYGCVSGMWQLHQSLGEMHDSWRYHWVFSMHPHSEKDISCNMKKFVKKNSWWEAWPMETPLSLHMPFHLKKKMKNERLPKSLHHLRFLSTTRINHAGLLFGKHGILLSHTWGAVVVHMLHSSTFRMLELFDFQHWSNAKAWISDVAQTWILTVLGEDQIVCEPSVVPLVQIRMTNCPLSHVHHPLHHRTLPLQDQVFLSAGSGNSESSATSTLGMAGGNENWVVFIKHIIHTLTLATV